MSSQGIYNSIVAEAYAQPLLVRSDEESLLRAKSTEEIFSVLLNTPLGQYIGSENRDMAQIELACEQYLYSFKDQAQYLYISLEIQKLLWAQYDFHNLSILTKAKSTGEDFPTIEPLLSTLGFYAKSTLYSHFISDTLYQLDPLIHEAYHKAYWHIEAGDVARAELEIEKHYWLYCKNYSITSQDVFIQEYLKIAIDLANIFSRIRSKNNNRIDFARYYVSGGNYGKEIFSNVDSAIALLEQYGGLDRWRSAVEECLSKGEGNAIERLRQTYLLEYAMSQTKTIFSISNFVKNFIAIQLECKKVSVLAIASLYSVPREKIASVVNSNI